VERLEVPAPDSTGAGPGAVAAVAVAALLLGLVVGFFLGRATEADDVTQAALPPLTSPRSETTRPPGDTVPQSAPADPGTPPSTDLDPTDVGTADSPVPVGQPYVLGLYEIEVRGVERDASRTLTQFEATNPAPPEGSVHVLVEIAVRSADTDMVGNPSSIPFFVGDGTDKWDDLEARCGLVPDALLDVGVLVPGDEVVGNACFTVPADAVGQLLLGTEGVNGDIYFELPE
jgi:hypothetical protein